MGLIKINTKKGNIKGIVSDGICVFKGVPYAKPPVGNLRFAPPEEMDFWNDEIDCTDFKNCPIQEDSVLINTKPSEDCLYINIWAPENAKDLPVFFWIHGGGFYNGCGTMNYYDGTHFAKDGVIVVTVDYRLGAIGYLALETSFKEYNTTGNWGTLDQIAALKWVNENISAFGGDPSKITIAGESAGSFSISNLIMSPLTKGLFSQAIMESGSLFENMIAVPFTEAKLDKAMKMSKEFAKVFGADDSKEGLEKLRQIDARTLWEMGYFSSDATVTAPFAFWAIQDGTVIPKDPIDALKNGEYNKVKYIIGYNKEEGNVFIQENLQEPVYNKYLYQTFKDRAQDVNQYYKDYNGTLTQKARDIVSISYFKAGMTLMQDELSKQGQDVYAYQFDFVPQGNYPLKAMGAHHAVEIPFVFGTNELVGLKYDEIGQRVEHQMHSMWVNFIKNGDPNIGIELPSNEKWEKYDYQNPKLYHFDKEMKLLETSDTDKIKFFQEIIYNKK